MYLKNSFDFSSSRSQRLWGVLAAILIPLALGLGLGRKHVVPRESFTTQAVFQLHFFAKVLPREPELILPRPTIAKAAIAQTAIAQTAIQHRGESLVANKAPKSKPDVLGIANLPDGTAQNAEQNLAVTANHPNDMKADNWAQQFKGKSSISAYQDARSEIQKMADRKGHALQAERANKYEAFQTAADNAAIPDCLARGTTTKLGLDSFKGLLVIPALAGAAAMGKCK